MVCSCDWEGTLQSMSSLWQFYATPKEPRVEQRQLAYQGARGAYGGYGPALRALAEAWDWLRAQGLVAKDPSQSATGAMFVTRLGHGVADDGLASDSFLRALAGYGRG